MWLQLLTVVLYIVLSVVTLAAIFEIYKYFDHDWCVFNKLPGPSDLYDNFFDFPRTTSELFQFEQLIGELYPKLVKFPILNLKLVICYNAEDIEYLISGHSTSRKGLIYEFMEPWFGTGLLTSEGEKWQKRRKMLTPAFHFNILQDFVKVFNEETKSLVSVLKNHCHEDYINVVPFISDSTLNTINETAMGISPDKTSNGFEYKKAIYRAGELIVLRVFKPWLHSDTVYKLTLEHSEIKRLLKMLHSYTHKVIKMREVDNYENVKETKNNDDFSYSTRKRLAMLDLLLEHKKNGLIDYEGIREEVDTFMFEGHDTVSMGICFALLVLANYESVQDDIRKEIYDVLGGNEDPTYENLTKLTYMDRCIKEILRLYPSVPNIIRITTKEGQSESGRIFPKNTLVVIDNYRLHRDTDFFPDPEKFDPDRFLAENCKGRHPFAYLPFSAGPRNCIGQKFANLEMKAVLCGILRSYNLKPVHRREDVIVRSELVLRPDDEGIRIKFEPRNSI